MISDKLEKNTQDELEDMVFSYIMSRNLDGIDISREDDGSLTVYIPMLNCRYATVDGHKQLTGYAGNWVDYMQLQENVVSAIESLTLNYQRYQICNEAYEEGNSNVKYMVRMMTDEGMCTYTNVSRLANLADNEVTESFNEYRRYLIYYPDSLVFMGNTIFSEEELDEYISIYSYAYPDTTHIWLGVDSNYAIEEDAFYAANAVYQKIVPNVGRVVALIVILALSWLGIGIYLTVTAGCYVSEDGGQIWHLNRFDRIWTEILLLLAAGLAYGGLLGYRMIVDVAETAGAMPAQILGIQLTMIYRYGLFVAYGVYLSIAFNLVWYSLVRRAKVGNLWKDSFLYFFGRSICNSMKFIFRHRNSVVSTLLPYNVFLFSNLAGIAIVYKLWEKQTYVMLILGAMVVVDGIVGVFMFRRGAEQAEIVEGINRIRDGEGEGSGVLRVVADNEGLDSELHLTINWGYIAIQAQNDGINTNEDGVSVTTINGGGLQINAGLGEEGDGIDSNGHIVINGGAVYSMASDHSPDGGLDADGEILINGGQVAALGVRNDVVTSDSKQLYMELSFASTLSAGSKVELEGTSLSFTLEKGAQSILYSAPELEQDVSYTLKVDGAVQQYTGHSGGGFGMGRPDGHPPGVRPAHGFRGNFWFVVRRRTILQPLTAGTERRDAAVRQINGQKYAPERGGGPR